MAEIIEKVYALLEPLLDGTDIFVVNIKVKPTNNLKVYLDADSGFSITKSSSVNRKLYAAIEAAGMFPDGDFSLEVSSPGVDEPLTQMRQYKKNIGRKVTVTDKEDKEVTGMLREVTDEHMVLEVKGKKASDPVKSTEIAFSNIKKTVVQIIF
ncbi:ribosome assembly cofactor RimP [Nemorincola caseinilytica]|uniref:Ribosome maturation factor RimP n=1 Tax=Nemorincola caseinilytica TaxID=2054315 RepID=A0ABP8NB43_9BACT